MSLQLFTVSAGHRVSDAAASLILSSGIPQELTGVIVRVIEVIHDPYDSKFIIEAASESDANIWKNYIREVIPSVTGYDPVPPEDPDPPPGSAAVAAKVGTWTKTIGVATTSITGLAAQPKAVFLFGSGLSAAAFGTFTDSGGLVFGFTDGTAQRCHGMAIQDNLGDSNANQWFGDRTFYILDPTGTHTTHIKEKGSVAFTANGFDITWDATALASVGGYLAIWGSDITNVAVKDFTIGTLDTGIKEYTGVGYQANFGFLSFPVGSGGTIPVARTGVNPCWSAIAGNSATRCWSTSFVEDDAAGTMDVFRLQRTAKVMGSIAVDANDASILASFSSWEPDGFKLNWTEDPDASGDKFTGIFIKGGKWDANYYTQPATGGTSPTGDVTASLADSSALVKALVCFSVGNVAQTGLTGNTHAKISIGATDGTTQVCTTYASNGGITTSQVATKMYDTKLIVHTTAAATATSSTEDGISTIQDIATAGQFKVNYSSSDGTARQVVWFALGA